MRRNDRLVDDLFKIFDILNRCDVVRLAMNDKGIPYVIPMTFGAEIVKNKIIVYFHSAGEGKKLDVLSKDNNVCVEADLYYKTVPMDDGGITAQYESVIGYGKAVEIDDKDEKVKSLKVILDHYKESGFPVTSCKGLPHVHVFKVVLDEVTGKNNM